MPDLEPDVRVSSASDRDPVGQGIDADDTAFGAEAFADPPREAPGATPDPNDRRLES